MALPTRTPQQRASALARANATRTARAEVLTRAETDPIASRTRVTALLKALPGVGDIGAGKLLTQLGIAPTRVGGLGATQRAALIATDL